MMLRKISPNVWKYTCSDKSNIYLLDLEKRIVIDAGNRADRQEVEGYLGKVVDLSKVDVVIFTHLHYDHIGNFDIFRNARFYASAEEIEDYRKDPEKAVLSDDIVKRFNVKLEELPDELYGLHVIKTPGHTRGSVCIWYPAEKILFTGDTLFGRKSTGRTDLPTSAPDKLNSSILKLVAYNHKLLAAGHDY